MLRTNGTVIDLRAIVHSAPPKKRENLGAAVAGFERWMRGKGILWTRRPKGTCGRTGS
jgi:hypothetical protein